MVRLLPYELCPTQSLKGSPIIPEVDPAFLTSLREGAMKVLGLFLPVLLLVGTPAMAVEFKGQNY
ncbi:hypothetical protein GXM_10467 [Nostoc sphaeroides CCNUC1]|uniref:Uncharacterized protein n=1 Tax=Nostoc sphaeroides CCNUC1 TaxID=2653204 RepID=A0A5P8WJT3_9NOSO|nr:hypothetical protein GXM_10467 [Nostoc sphaeroides CCNUC1]